MCHKITAYIALAPTAGLGGIRPPNGISWISG